MPPPRFRLPPFPEAALAALALLLCSAGLAPAQAATRVLAAGGSCGNHGSIGSSFVSCSDSRNAGCTAAKPCCTFQDASNAATANGDVIEVHHGTYSDGTGYSDGISKYAVRLNTAGVTLRRASGDNPTLDLGAVNHMGVLVAKSRITVDGLRIVGGIGGTDTQRVAHILVASVGDAVIRDNTLEVSTSNHVGSISGNMCIKLEGSTRFIVENNTCRGGWDFSIWVNHVFDAGGGVIRGNAQFGDGRGGSGSQRGMIFQALGNPGDGGTLLVYNNTLEQSPTSEVTFGMYLRELHWRLYFFNNIVRGVRTNGIYFQDDLCTGTPARFHEEQWHIFHNTFVAGGSGGSKGIAWPSCITASVRNNIFVGFSSGASLGGGTCPTQICSTRDDAPRSESNSHFTHNLCHDHSDCVSLEPGAAPVTTESLVTNRDPLLDGAGRIASSSSGAIDRGTNDPLGQGPGVCSVTSGSVTADCTKDIDGRPRGSGAGWDLGASEAPSAPVSPPGRVQTIYRDDARRPE